MKPLTLEETRLKEEMKARCLAKGQYIDEKAKDKFDMLCHLEDFEVQYWELQQENKQLKEKIKKVIRMLEIQIEAIKVQPSDNALNDNMEIKQREKVINLLNEVSE